MSETTENRPADVLRELARKLARQRELVLENMALNGEIDGLTDRLAFLVPSGARYFRVPTYRNYAHTTEVVCLERETCDGGGVYASLVPASDADALEWPEPSHSVNPDVPCGVAAAVAAVIDDDAA